MLAYNVVYLDYFQGSKISDALVDFKGGLEKAERPAWTEKHMKIDIWFL
jgi:hypothetical protein